MVAEARLDPGLGQMGQLPLLGESTKVVAQPPGPSLCFLHGPGESSPSHPLGGSVPPHFPEHVCSCTPGEDPFCPKSIKLPVPG